MTKKHKTLLILTTTVFIFLLLAVLLKKTDIFDQIIYDKIRSIKLPYLNDIAILITKLGNIVPVTIVCIIYLILKPKEGKYVIACVITSLMLNLLIKNLVARVRPDSIWLIKETGFSFPSGHAMASMSLYGMILYFINVNNIQYKKLITTLLSGLIILVGLSRVYVGVHFPSDILAGFSLSFSIVLIYCYLYQKEVEYVSKKI